jgi:dihydroorotase
MLTLRRPDDWHVHLRDGALLQAIAAHHAAFGRVLAMPNLVPPVARAAEARSYRERLGSQLPAGTAPRMVCYLTDHTDPDDLAQGFVSGVWVAAKWYPARATTNAHHGVTDPMALIPCLLRMAELGMPLCVHGEVTDPAVDIFEREQVFLDTVLDPILQRTGVRCVVEHATTAHAVAFVESHERVAATITPHHLWWNRNALFEGGLRPHAYCLPVLKREEDRQALVRAATSGDARFFAGTDSAPHLVSQKEKDCGCAGVFNAPTAIAAYAQIFEEAGALGRLEGFLSLHGAAFYGEEPSSERVTLERRDWTPPPQIEVPGHGAVRVFLGGERLSWSLAGPAA